MFTINKKMMRFDDENAEVFFIELDDNGAIVKITHCTTSRWRKLLFKLGINVYYKMKEYKYKRETNPESNE